MYISSTNDFMTDTSKVINLSIINKNIIFCDIDNNGKIVNYTYQEFEDLVGRIKSYLLSKYEIKPGETALVGYPKTCTYKIAAFFACLELGLSVTIIDYHKNVTKPKFGEAPSSLNGAVDTKTQLLSPINYLICGRDPLYVQNNPKNKLSVLCAHCLNTIYHKDIMDYNYDKTISNNLTIDPKSIAIKCTSSGTIGTPKVIEHTHEFLFDLCKRNSKMYYGNVVNEECLGHGSGPATYFIPTLMSKNVTKIFNVGSAYNFTPTEYPIRHQNLFNHMMIAYTDGIDIYLRDIDKDHPETDLTIYTLYTIKKEWIPFVKEKKIKNIVSLFGTSETSGPIFTNQADDQNFVQNKFNLIDDYYPISFTNENLLEVNIPTYNKKVCTNDKFLIDYNNGHFYHEGRSDLIRINGKNVDVSRCDEILSKLSGIIDAKFIYDTAVNEIYLAVWEPIPKLDILIKKINVKMQEFSYEQHQISKYKVLDKTSFFTGIKLDNQLLRDYFRSIDN
jgi:hypothetical protein